MPENVGKAEVFVYEKCYTFFTGCIYPKYLISKEDLKHYNNYYYKNKYENIKFLTYK